MSFTVLIADDSDLIRERLALMLTELKDVHVVGQAATGLEAISLAQQLEPNLVILDIHMPKVNGIAALQEIKQTTSSRVMMFTAYPYPQYRTKCCELGADSFLDKNTEFGRVNRVIERMQSESI